MMKKFILFLALALLASSVAAGPYDLRINQRNSTDTGDIGRLFPTLANNADGIMYLNGTTKLPDYLLIGSGLQSVSGVLSALPQQNADWNATTGVTSILNKPSFATVAFSGNYDDLSNKSSIPTAQVNADWNAVSGLAQILNKPSIPAAQVNFDWNASSGVSQILNRPALASVAISGNYSDLTNKPTIPAAQVNSDWSASSGVAVILNKPAFAAVATSGAYADLSGKPTIPAAFAVGTLNTRTLSLATAYQCTDTSKACIVTIALNSSASLSLTGGTTITGEVRIGSSNAVATGSGLAVGAYKNSLTGTLAVGLNIQSETSNTITVVVPAGYYFAVRQTAGSGLTIVLAFDQSAG